MFPNEEFLLAGYLTAKLTNAHLYPYFHNTFLEQCAVNSVHHRIAQWLQSRVFDEADHIFLMSDGMV
ncbi:MAG: hypothetical protein E6R14_00505 [Thermomicrobiales bacterium]|nr:MAG: hypothetical protein E6R14_00505 [Thermomicrobiales bacterium]